MRLGRRVRRNSLDQRRELGRRPFGPQAIGIENGVLGLQQPPERILFLARRAAEALIDIAREQNIQLLHAPAASPAQFPEFLSHQWRRWPINCLISPMAFAGLRSFGQASVQFMMVWQRYRRNGSSR